jgi:hypothetical protein
MINTLTKFVTVGEIFLILHFSLPKDQAIDMKNVIDMQTSRISDAQVNISSKAPQNG